jgi:hypothetical protein
MTIPDTPRILEVAEWAVREIGDRFTQPDDDWAPTLMYTTGHDERVIVDLGIRSPDNDDNLARIEQTLTRMHATEAVFITSCWTSSNGIYPCSSDPDRGECVTMCHVTRDSAEILHADIERFADRSPRLGPLRSKGGGPDLGGQFPDAMRRGIGMNERGQDAGTDLDAGDTALAALMAAEARRKELHAKFGALKSRYNLGCPEFSAHHDHGHGPAAVALKHALDARSVHLPGEKGTFLPLEELPAADIDLLIELCDRLATAKGKRWNAQFELRAAKDPR